MQVNLIAHSFYEKYEAFKTETLTTRWDGITVVVDGSYTLQIRGAERLQTAVAGDIVFVPSGTQITRRITTPMTFYIISFDTQADHPFRHSLPVGKLALPKDSSAAILSSMRQAALVPNNQELIVHILEHIMAENYLFGRTYKAGLRPLSDEVAEAVEYMNRNFRRKIDMKELASRVYLSHTGLIWKFKRELDTTPSGYLILLRLRHAKQLLLDHDYSVSDVAEMCGYSNPFYFTNAFRGYTGMSPTEFRKQYKEMREE